MADTCRSSTPGHGTVFRVMLPPSDAAKPARGGPRCRVRRSAAARGRVLVVEDEAMVGDFMAELLASWGLEVELHRDPLAASAWLEEASNRSTW